MNENYYLLLNLSIERFISGDEALKSLDMTLKKWRASNNTTERDKAEKYEKPIKEAITNPDSWSRQFEDAKRLVNDALNSWIMVARGKGYITPEEISEKAKALRINTKIKSYKISEQFILNVINAKNITVQNDVASEVSGATIDDFKPKSEIRFKQALTSLEQLSCESFYQFLEKYQVNSKFAFSEDSQAMQCVNTAKMIEEEWKDKKENAEKSAINTLCTAIILHFAKPDDDMCQAEYNKMLVYTKIKAIFAELNGNFKGSNNKVLDDNSREIYIKKIMNVVSDRATAESILLNYCSTHEISALKKLALNSLCPFCGNLFEKIAGKVHTVCPVCHKSFILTCPKCKKESNLSETNVCNTVGCKFNFEQYSRLKRKCDEAREYIKILNFEFALVRINEVERAWNNFPELKDLKEEFESKKRDFGNIIDSLNKYILENKFYTAKREYLNIKKLISGYSDIVLEERIENAIRTADELYKKARLEKDNNLKLQLLIKATETVSDHAEAIKDLGNIAPEPVMNIQCNVPENAQYVDITWKSPNKENTAIYVILRKEYSKPISTEDGRIAQVSEKAYCDKDIKTGVPYFYSVYALRGNNKSQICSTLSPVIVFPIIRDIKAFASENSVSVKWKADTENVDVEVFRCGIPTLKKYGEGFPVIGISDNGFDDRGLKVSSTYYYNIFLTKKINAKKIISAPISISISTVKIGKKIDFEIEQQDEIFYLNLKEPLENDETVEFFTSPKPVIIPNDGVIMYSDIENGLGLTQLRVETENPERYVFVPEKGESGYIYSVSVKDNIAVVGYENYFENIEMIPVKSIRSDGINMFIELKEFPKNVNTMTVAYRNDRHPVDPNEPGNMKLIVNRMEYNSRNIAIPLYNNMVYYICGFVRGGNGQSTIFKATYGARQKINIDFTVSKSFFFKYKRKLIIELSEEVALPEMMIRYKYGSAVDNSMDGEKLMEISSKLKSRHFEFTINFPENCPKNTAMYFNIFLKDISLYSQYQLRLKSDSYRLM